MANVLPKIKSITLNMHFSERFRQFIAENQLFSPNEVQLLAVSGGKDSVLMVQLFAESGYRFSIAHCNFQLRGEASDADEQFVEALASSLQVRFFSTRFETDRYARQQGVSIQMAARTLRYSWLEEVRSAHQYQSIVVGHHQTDSVETIFLNMLRGTGVAGLSGIAPKREHIVRPLLAFSAQQVAEEVQRRNLPYREDASNASTKYTRNAIRLEVLPALRRLNPDLEQTLLANARRMSQVASYLQQEVSRIRETLFVPGPSGVFRIRLEALKNLQPRELMLYELFHPYGFTEAVLNDLSREWDGIAGRRFFSASHCLLLNRDELLLQPVASTTQAPLRLAEVPASFCWYGQQYRVYLSDIAGWKCAADRQALDFDKLNLPLTVRSWQDGDAFRPLGMQGRKKISDFLIGRKLARTAKAEVPLVVDGSGGVVAVLPWRIDDRFKVTGETKKVLIFENISHG